MHIAKRANQLEPSATLAASAKANALKAQGVDVLSLTVGEPDFITPENIQKAAIQAIQDGRASFYKPTAGIPELIEAIISRTQQDYGLTYQKDQVIVADGAKFILFNLFQAILNEGDEVIIPTPYWVSYGEQVKLAMGTPIFVEGKQTESFKVTVAQLEAARTPKTQAMILNSPSNPTGNIYSKEELTQIGNWAVAHNILIIADDIYGKLVYNDNVFTPIATISEAIRKQTIVVNGVSKSYSMTGWRIGYALGDETIIRAMVKIASQSISNATAVSQYAAVEALAGAQTKVEEMRQAFENRLNEIYPKIASLPGFTLEKPQGAFYFFPNVSAAMTMCGYSDVNDFVADLLTEAHVAVVTGIGFGAPEHIRLSYATDLATFEKALGRIETFIRSKKQTN